MTKVRPEKPMEYVAKTSGGGIKYPVEYLGPCPKTGKPLICIHLAEEDTHVAYADFETGEIKGLKGILRNSVKEVVGWVNVYALTGEGYTFSDLHTDELEALARRGSSAIATVKVSFQAPQ